MRTHTSSPNPFPGNGHDNYFFTTPALRLRLDLVQEYIRRGGTPVLMLGEPGAGKSTLLNQLVCRADHDWRIVRVPAVASFSADDVVTFINAELRLPTRTSVADMLRTFDRWLERLAVRGQTAVVVVDDADGFDDGCLRRLATLPDELGSENLRVVMTGEPALRTRLNDLAGSRSIPTVSIPCLDKREVASYIDMRLYHAGLEGRGPFSRAMVNDIATGSRGHPGRINAMANEVLKAERRGPRLEWAQQRIRRFMRHWLTLSVISN